MTEADSERRYDSRPFRRLNGRSSVSWDERMRTIRKVFPTTANLDWVQVFDDEPEVMGRILQDVTRSMQATPGKPGPRPVLDRRRAQPVVDRWLGKDPKKRPYSVLPFPEAFKLLVADRSVRHVAVRLGWTKSRVARLLAGDQQPVAVDMEEIAAAFDKSPSYFLEYRIAWSVTAFLSSLEASPEQTVRVYEQLRLASG
jgi:transcriptional regulator with XRE-family HTH domain